jgi:hypothetical protein
VFTRRFFADMVARLSGKGRFRFIMQPIVAILLGGRERRERLAARRPPPAMELTFHGERRKELLPSAFASVRNLVAVAIPLDIISQFLIFREIHSAAALLLGPVLIVFPFAAFRALTNRVSWRNLKRQTPRAA